MSWLTGPRRTTESSAQQLAVTGASGGYGSDPIDGSDGFRPAGSAGRPVPAWTLEKGRAYSVASYRINPMARAVIDTYTSFCVGDSGLTLQCLHPEVERIAAAFWDDPANFMAQQDIMLRSALLLGERADEMMVGRSTGVVQRSVIDPTRIEDVSLRAGNPLWPEALRIRNGTGTPDEKRVISIDPVTGRRSGDVEFLAWFRALDTDRRGYPFLGPIIDWLDSYDNVLANLVDRTALARYLVWDVTVEGDQAAVNKYIADRKGTQAPRSGSVEVHNSGVTWEPKTADVGANEDTTTAQALLTNVAAGAGLGKTWLAEPEDSNRATSLTMGEPIRRRVGGVQNAWITYVTEFPRFAVDQAVAAGRLEAEVEIKTAGGPRRIPAAQCVTITGPEIADEPAMVRAEVLAKLSEALTGMTAAGLLSKEAAAMASRKAWEDYMGIPWSAELSQPEAKPDDLATYVDQNTPPGKRPVLDLVG